MTKHDAERREVHIRMDRELESRVLRREILISARTPLKTLAATIREAWGWWDAKRAYRFESGEESWASNHHGPAANGRRVIGSRTFEDVHRPGGPRLEFIHNVTGGVRVSLEVVAVRPARKPETAYPQLVKLVGIPPTAELTADDSMHQCIMRAQGKSDDEPSAHDMKMLLDEDARREHEGTYAEYGVEAIRLSRRGPLRSHRPDSRRHGGAGPAPEPETERRSLTPPTRKPLTLPKNGAGRPTVLVSDDKAIFKPNGETLDIRIEISQILEDAEWEPSRADLKEIERLARRAGNDPEALIDWARALQDTGWIHEADAVYGRIIEIGETLLPDGFKGRFMLAANTDDAGAAIAAAAAEAGVMWCENAATGKGLKLLEKGYRWDPDPQGFAARNIGTMYVAAGRFEAGRAIIETVTERAGRRSAGYEYDLAAVSIRERNWDRATLEISRGLALNPYIAHTLLYGGRPWEIDNPRLKRERAMYDAGAHWRRTGRVWESVKGLQFLQWIATHPVIAAENARLLELDRADSEPFDAVRREVERMREADIRAAAEELRMKVGHYPWEEITRPGRGPGMWRW